MKNALNEEGIPTGILAERNPELLKRMKALSKREGATTFVYRNRGWGLTTRPSWLGERTYKVEHEEVKSKQENIFKVKACIECPLFHNNGAGILYCWIIDYDYRKDDYKGGQLERRHKKCPLDKEGYLLRVVPK